MDDNGWGILINSGAAIAAAVSAITSAISARAAYRAIKQNDLLHSNEQKSTDAQRENTRLFDHAIMTLERAFMALMGGDPTWNVPPKSRLNWLTAARLIEEFKNTKERISDPLLVQECLSHEAHWRLQFARKLEELGTGHPDYFKQSGKVRIHLTSAVIVCAFSEWMKELDDAIDERGSPLQAVETLGVSPQFAQLKFHLGIL
ncbi:hypothetical protein [Pseudomonas monachiensis]|uniref:Uncharacterized protein n=1 Tax=Pseudomonas monachiensis TaxID=3060212 RepID=A0ABW9HA44_9PSED